MKITFNYEEITLANGCKIKEIKNCKGDLICRKIREQTGVLNGEPQYGAETESFRVVYRTDENGEVLSEISYTIDKMPAIDAGTPDDSSQWLYSDYSYDENGELRSVARRGYRAGSDSVCRDKGGRVSSEDYRFDNGFVDQCYIYDYNQNDAGANRPGRSAGNGCGVQKRRHGLINTLKFGYDELGRVKSRKVLSPSGTELLEDPTATQRVRRWMSATTCAIRAVPITCRHCSTNAETRLTPNSSIIMRPAESLRCRSETVLSSTGTI